MESKETFAAWLESAPAESASLASTMRWLAPCSSAVASLGCLERDALLALFLELVAPRLQPRYYTISSSKKCDGATVHVTVALLDLPSPAKKKKGLCSGFLADLRVGATCSAFVRASSFRAPRCAPAGGAPLVLVGPGTGVAPMRAVLRERAAWATEDAGDADLSGWKGAVSSATLYFGCKRRDQDHLYFEEMQDWLREGVLDTMQVAYSRQNEAKVYVQDLMRRPEDAERLRDQLLRQKGAVFVCGGTAMGNSVCDALRAIFAQEPGFDARKAAEHVEQMQLDGRYVQELWA